MTPPSSYSRSEIRPTRGVVREALRAFLLICGENVHLFSTWRMVIKYWKRKQHSTKVPAFRTLQD